MKWPDVYLRLTRLELDLLEMAMAGGYSYADMVERINIGARGNRIDSHVVDHALCRIKQKMQSGRINPSGALPRSRKPMKRKQKSARPKNIPEEPRHVWDLI